MNTLISRPRRCLGTSVGFVSEAAGPRAVCTCCAGGPCAGVSGFTVLSPLPAGFPRQPSFPDPGLERNTRRRGVSPLPGTGSARAVKKRHTRSSASQQPVSRRKSTSGRACSGRLPRQPRSCTHLSPICRLPASQKWSRGAHQRRVAGLGGQRRTSPRTAPHHMSGRPWERRQVRLAVRGGCGAALRGGIEPDLGRFGGMTCARAFWGILSRVSGRNAGERACAARQVERRRARVRLSSTRNSAASHAFATGRSRAASAPCQV